MTCDRDSTMDSHKPIKDGVEWFIVQSRGKKSVFKRVTHDMSPYLCKNILCREKILKGYIKMFTMGRLGGSVG